MTMMSAIIQHDHKDSALAQLLQTSEKKTL